MKRTSLFLLLALAAAAGAAPTVKTTAGRIVLSSGGAEYSFENGKFYHLKESKFKGKSFWVKGFELTYNMPGDKWHWEDKPCDIYKMNPYTHKIVRNGDALTLETRGEGTHMSLFRNYTLRGDSPDLEVQIRMEIRGENKIYWLNLFSTSAPVTQQCWRLVSRVKEGQIVTQLEHVPSPFVDPAAKKFRKYGNLTLQQLTGETFSCFYDAKVDVGAVMMQMPEHSRLPMRFGQSKADSKNYYNNVSPYFFYGTEKNSSLDAWVKVIPFTGNPAELNCKIVPAFVEKMQTLYALPRIFATGTTLKTNGDFALWSDFASQKIYPDTPAPAKRAAAVELFAARDEGEGFNLALRPSKLLKQVSLKLEGIPFAPQYFPVQTIKREQFFGIVGEHPDVLLEQAAIDCAADRTQNFYIKYKVPENAKPGVYNGTVKVLSNGKELAAVPVKLTVRNFSIAEHTLTAAFDFWWRQYGYKNYKADRAKIEKMVIEARGGGRWLEPVKVKFDAEGNLVSADYTAFDKSVELYTKVYRQPILIARCFMLGYGHELRDNLFGKKAEILTPLWKKKVLNFAQDFRKHVQKLQISDRIVLDLFDEPYEDTYSAINEMVALLRSVAPEWRFTYAGNMAQLVRKSINFWNTGNDLGLREISMMKADKAQYSVYNPPNYGDNAELVKVRGFYNYLWHEDINYVYQWVINCWSDQGNGGWDHFRCASWVVSSPDGPLSTLRMENTRDGIEDYEYCRLLEKEIKRLETKAPELAARGRAVLEKARKLTGRSPKDEVRTVLCNNPQRYEEFHREAGIILEKMAELR